MFFSLWCNLVLMLIWKWHLLVLHIWTKFTLSTLLFINLLFNIYEILFVYAKVSRWLQMWKNYLSSAFFVSGCCILVYVAQNVYFVKLFNHFWQDILRYTTGFAGSVAFSDIFSIKKYRKKRKNTFLKVNKLGDSCCFNDYSFVPPNVLASHI